MPAWLSGLIKDVLWSLTLRLWERLDHERKLIVAADLVNKLVEDLDKQRKADFELIDRLIASQGKPLTLEQKDAIRKERARLELELWNTNP